MYLFSFVFGFVLFFVSLSFLFGGRGCGIGCFWFGFYFFFYLFAFCFCLFFVLLCAQRTLTWSCFRHWIFCFYIFQIVCCVFSLFDFSARAMLFSTESLFCWGHRVHPDFPMCRNRNRRLRHVCLLAPMVLWCIIWMWWYFQLACIV